MKTTCETEYEYASSSQELTVHLKEFIVDSCEGYKYHEIQSMLDPKNREETKELFEEAFTASEEMGFYTDAQGNPVQFCDDLDRAVEEALNLLYKFNFEQKSFAV